jgi:release factor glutamine methyltransferase
MNTEIAANEPSMAFDGGMFGTRIIQKVISEAPKFLVKGGWLVFEIGLGQGDFIAQLCRNSGQYVQVEALPDAQGHTRAIAAQKL